MTSSTDPAATRVAPASPALLRQAAEDAARAQRAAGVTIALLGSQAAQLEACRLWNDVWDREGQPPVSPELLRALAYAGNYVAGAREGGRLVGAVLGFYAGGAGPDHMHSHMAGVDSTVRGRGVGFAMKLHQRHWALERGLARITWTFDPLVRLNGVFNLAKLGAEGDEYLVDFYGSMPDAINGGDETDRIVVTWDLTHPRVAAAAAGTPATLEPAPLLEVGAGVALDVGEGDDPVPGLRHGEILLCRVPRDIVALRRRDPTLGLAWRRALREALVGASDRGLRIRGITRDGWYVLAAPSAHLPQGPAR